MYGNLIILRRNVPSIKGKVRHPRTYMAYKLFARVEIAKSAEKTVNLGLERRGLIIHDMQIVLWRVSIEKGRTRSPTRAKETRSRKKALWTLR